MVLNYYNLTIFLTHKNKFIFKIFQHDFYHIKFNYEIKLTAKNTDKKTINLFISLEFGLLYNENFIIYILKG